MLIKTVEKCIQATLQKLTNVISSEIRFGRYILPSIVSDSAIQRFRSARHNTKVKRRKELTLIMILIRCPLSSFSPSQMEDGSSNGRMECSYSYRIESLE